MLLLLSLPVHAGVAARLSTTTTALDQPVQLTLEIEDAGDASPDLTPLENDFEILGRASRQSVSIINGQVSSKRALILTLLPRRTGDLTIPPIAIGNHQTESLRLEVSEQASTPADAMPTRQAWVELSLNKAEAFPEEEVILTLKLYRAAGVRGESLDQPRPSTGDTRLQLLDESTYTMERDGQPYRVLERSYGVYAYQTGNLEIAPVEFRGRSGGTSLFNLLDDPFGSPLPRSQPVRAKSNAVSLSIKPIPDAFTGDHWLPAKNLQLVATGIDSRTPVQTGKPLTRRIMLIADGLMSSQLPAVSSALPDDIKAYEERPQMQDTPRSSGISSSRETVVTLIPTQAGRFTLPAIEIPWWNTETGQQEVARLPEVTLEVLPGATTSSTATPAAQPQPLTQAPLDGSLDSADSPPLPVAEKGGIHWLVWVLAAAWIATLAGWWISHHRRTLARVSDPPAADTEPTQHDSGPVLDALIKAYRETDAAAARDAWLSWGRIQWPEKPPHNLARLALRCPHEVAEAVLRLEKALYSPADETDWSLGFDPSTLREPVEPAPQPAEVEERLLPLNP